MFLCQRFENIIKNQITSVNITDKMLTFPVSWDCKFEGLCGNGSHAGVCLLDFSRFADILQISGSLRCDHISEISAISHAKKVLSKSQLTQVTFKTSSFRSVNVVSPHDLKTNAKSVWGNISSSHRIPDSVDSYLNNCFLPPKQW